MGNSEPDQPGESRAAPPRSVWADMVLSGPDEPDDGVDEEPETPGERPGYGLAGYGSLHESAFTWPASGLPPSFGQRSAEGERPAPAGQAAQDEPPPEGGWALDEAGSRYGSLAGADPAGAGQPGAPGRPGGLGQPGVPGPPEAGTGRPYVGADWPRPGGGWLSGQDPAGQDPAGAAAEGGGQAGFGPWETYEAAEGYGWTAGYGVVPGGPQAGPGHLAPEAPEAGPGDLAPETPQAAPGHLAPEGPQAGPGDLAPGWPAQYYDPLPEDEPDCYGEAGDDEPPGYGVAAHPGAEPGGYGVQASYGADGGYGAGGGDGADGGYAAEGGYAADGGYGVQGGYGAGGGYGTVAPPGDQTAGPAQPPRWQSESADSLTADVLLPGRHAAPPAGWRRRLYQFSGGLVRAPQSATDQRRKDLMARARTPVAEGHHRIAVLSLKGGVGKTTTTVGLGATLASLRGDRVIAVDANPDRGTLSDKLRLETAATVRDLLNEVDQIRRYADVRAYTTQAVSGLEVLASDRDPTVSVAFSAGDYADVARLLEHYYSVCVTDCGTGLLHSAMAGVLRLADQIVLVSSASVDGARGASATLDWLAAHQYGDLVRGGVVVLSAVRPRNKSAVDLARLEQHFAARCRAVVRIPYDAHLAEGAEVDLARLSRATADAYLVLAAEVGDGFAWARR